MANATQGTYELLTQPFKRCFALIEAADRNRQLAIYGLRQIAMLEIARVPFELHPRRLTVLQGLLADAQIPSNYGNAKLKREIDTEIDRGFPSLSSYATIALWTATEEFVRNFSVFWIRAYPDQVSLKNPNRETKIGTDDLLHLDARRDDLAGAVAKDIMQRSNKISVVERFESLLEGMQLLIPELSSTLRSDLVELEAVRHIVVHNGSVVDEQFKLRCPKPTVPERIGEDIIVSDDRFNRYKSAVYGYASLMMRRVHSARPETARGV